MHVVDPPRKGKRWVMLERPGPVNVLHYRQSTELQRCIHCCFADFTACGTACSGKFLYHTVTLRFERVNWGGGVQVDVEIIWNYWDYLHDYLILFVWLFEIISLIVLRLFVGWLIAIICQIIWDFSLAIDGNCFEYLHCYRRLFVWVFECVFEYLLDYFLRSTAPIECQRCESNGNKTLLPVAKGIAPRQSGPCAWQPPARLALSFHGPFLNLLSASWVLVGTQWWCNLPSLLAAIYGDLLRPLLVLM